MKKLKLFSLLNQFYSFAPLNKYFSGTYDFKQLFSLVEKNLKIMLIENFSSIKFIVAITFVLTELFTALCDNRTYSRSFGGKFVDISETPYVVLILVTMEKMAGKCTGSLIAEEWVLSAAHCFPTVKFENIKIIAGIDDMDVVEDMQVRVPLKIITHPYYVKDGSLKWDFALAQIKSFDMTSEKVGIVPLGDDIWPQDEQMYKRKCMAVGWGLPDNVTKNNTRLHSTKVLAEHGSVACKCLKSYQKKRAVCLRRGEGVGICGGDSGGPLICNGKHYGVAHIIYDISKCTYMDVPEKLTCGRLSTVGVYMYTCPELDWIKSYVGVTPVRPLSCGTMALFKESNILVILLVAFINLNL
ncbi:snake venom serine protease rhinocerase 5-like isoform X1 [Rhodnius prolixus]|uniref:snake venom serine protease rhinocerase 5-like isoform X1 n=1 Tax=Rhodnius prolixus TaxID=13249 RepID=UPI003D18F29E